MDCPVSAHSILNPSQPPTAPPPHTCIPYPVSCVRLVRLVHSSKDAEWKAIPKKSPAPPARPHLRTVHVAAGREVDGNRPPWRHRTSVRNIHHRRRRRQQPLHQQCGKDTKAWEGGCGGCAGGGGSEAYSIAPRPADEADQKPHFDVFSTADLRRSPWSAASQRCYSIGTKCAAGIPTPSFTQPGTKRVAHIGLAPPINPVHTTRDIRLSAQYACVNTCVHTRSASNLCSRAAPRRNALVTPGAKA
eukprot:365504-Chlamydomonas_euryale.AAC.4